MYARLGALSSSTCMPPKSMSVLSYEAPTSNRAVKSGSCSTTASPSRFTVTQPSFDIDASGFILSGLPASGTVGTSTRSRCVDRRLCDREGDLLIRRQQCVTRAV
jgi:hypothetical protein